MGIPAYTTEARWAILIWWDATTHTGEEERIVRNKKPTQLLMDDKKEENIKSCIY